MEARCGEQCGSKTGDSEAGNLKVPGDTIIGRIEQTKRDRTWAGLMNYCPLYGVILAKLEVEGEKEIPEDHTKKGGETRRGR